MFVRSCRSVLVCAAVTFVACAAPTGSSDDESTGFTASAESWSAPPCGAVIGSFDGTAAHSNGVNTGTGNSCAGSGKYGLQYQCVELVMRHFDTHWGLRWYGNAADLLNNAPRAQVDVFYNGDAAHPPRAGDMIVWNNTKWGHVALVTNVTSGYVDILEQNVWGAGGTARLPRSGGRIHGPSGWGWADPAGWAHAKANGGGAPPPSSSDPCASVSSGGLYCGQSGQNGFHGTTDDLYDCESGATKSKTVCAAGCEVMPAGTNDRCRPDPCAHVSGGGYFCGESTQYGFTDGVHGWLYLCNGGRTQSHVACASGCEVMPAGENDRCR